VRAIRAKHLFGCLELGINHGKVFQRCFARIHQRCPRCIFVFVCGGARVQPLHTFIVGFDFFTELPQGLLFIASSLLSFTRSSPYRMVPKKKRMDDIRMIGQWLQQCSFLHSMAAFLNFKLLEPGFQQLDFVRHFFSM